MRFYQPKKYERKKYAVRCLPVSIPLGGSVMLHRISIPLGLVSVPPLLVSLPLAIYRTACVTQVSQLQARLTKVSLPPNWVELRQQEMSSRLTTMTLVNFRPQTIFTTASFVVNIHEHLTWTLQCYNSPIETDQCQAIANVPQKLLCVSDVVDLLTTVQSSTLCCGNPAEEFRGLVELHDGTFKDPTGMCIFLFSRTAPSFFTASSFVIYVGTRTIAYHDMQSLSYSTIRHSSCEFLLPHSSKSKRCKNCASFRNNLRIRQKRVEERTANRTSSSSNVPYSCLSEQELKTRMKAIHAELRRVQKQRDRLKLQLSEASEKQGLILDDDTHADLKKIMLKESRKRVESLPPNSFQRLFWEQQLQSASVKDAKGMRWHPLMIRWCLYLRHQSNSAYETLRKSGCITLPSQRTLRDYTHYIKAAPGFAAEVDQQLMDVAKLQSCQEWEKCVIIILDEMHIREDLVFDKHSGALIGFTNLGEVNSHLLAYEHSISQSEKSPEPAVAQTMMTFMVRGLCTKLSFPYAQFPCRNVTGDQLYDPFWEAVGRLERCGFKVNSDNIACYILCFLLGLISKFLICIIGAWCNI